MRTPDNRDERWNAVRTALRDAGVVESVHAGEKPPPGLATRLVARVAADVRADAAGLVLWRRWCLGGAAAALLVLGIGVMVVPDGNRDSQFMPVPELETPEDLAE